MVKVKKDLTGQKFNHLTVIQQAEDKIRPNGKHEAAWECECDCIEKNKVVVRQSDLTRTDGKAVKSCGKCFYDKVRVKEDLTGIKFNHLTVIKQAEDYVKPNGQHEAQWLCQCDCIDKNICIILGTSLKNGNTTSCGCVHRTQAALNGQQSRKGNVYELNLKDKYGLYGIGYCSNTNAKYYFDMDDYNKICEHTWGEHILQSGYHALETNIDDIITRMSWIIVGKYYDHEDRNPLNNRKYNLRKASFSENAQNISRRKDNKSGVTGVFYNKKDCRWSAYINVNKKRLMLGCYVDKTNAIKVRLNAEVKYYGEFAPQRHLFEQYGIEYNPEDKIKGGDSNE